MDKLAKPTVYIALLGVTGAGKTTFTSLVSGRKDLKIGYGVDPCTQEPLAVDFMFHDRKVVLVDTPGFDDDTRSDVDILSDIARWMGKQGYSKARMFDGLIFLHPITLNRVGGSERSRTRLLEKILGEHAYNRVVIASTMWDDLKSEANAEARLSGRSGAGGVWHDMHIKGATIVKHYNNKESAEGIILRIINITDQLGKVVPQLHMDLKATRGHVGRTGAGKELERQLRRDIMLLEKDLEAHLQDRPPEYPRNERTPRNREEWKEWHVRRREILERLELRQQQVKRLKSMVVRFFGFFASIFGG